MFSSANSRWGTPRPFYQWLSDAFGGFTIDLAADAENHKHPRYYAPRHNSLKRSWADETGFGNWPYGRGDDGITPWVKKSLEQACWARAHLVQLVPARVDTKWWRLWALNEAKEAGKLRRSAFRPDTRTTWLEWEGCTTGIYFHDKRLPFEVPSDAAEPSEKRKDPDSAPFPSAVVFHLSHDRKHPRPVKGFTGLPISVPPWRM